VDDASIDGRADTKWLMTDCHNSALLIKVDLIHFFSFLSSSVPFFSESAPPSASEPC